MMHDVAGDTNGGASVLADPSDFSTLQSNVDESARHNLCTILTSLLLLGNNGRVCSGTAAENSLAVRTGPNAEDLGSDRNHGYGQAVASPACFRSQNTGINDTAHGIEQVLGKTGPVALHHVSSPHAIRRNDIALLPCGLLLHQRDMRAATGIVLDAQDCVRTRSPSFKVDHTDSSLVTTTAVSDGNATAVVTTTLRLALLGEGKRQIRPALPQMIVDRALQVTDTGRVRLVGPHHAGVPDVGSYFLGLGILFAGADGGGGAGAGAS